jgi:ABC-type enterochelin transport system substrate-binding protein
MVDVSKEDFDKLRQEFTDFAVMTDKSMGRVKEELDTKATLIELANLQAGLMDKLNELMGNLENMFADKEGTRKKIAQIEKSVSLIFIIF